MAPVEILGFLGGIITGITFLPQIYKTYKSKSVNDISISMFSLAATGNVLWLAYGIIQKSPSIIVTNVVVLISALLMIYFKLRYGKKQ